MSGQQPWPTVESDHPHLLREPNGDDLVSRVPRALPADSVSAAEVRRWSEDPAGTYAALTQLDLRGADFANCDLLESWFNDSNLENVSFRGADLDRAHLDGTDIRHADFTGAYLGRAEFSGNNAHGAIFDRANLTRAEFYEVDARGATMRGAELAGARFSASDLRGVDLSDTHCHETILRHAVVDDTTVCRGMTGSLRGQIRWTVGDQVRALQGPDLQAWLNCRGADVVVLDTHSAPGLAPRTGTERT